MRSSDYDRATHITLILLPRIIKLFQKYKISYIILPAGTKEHDLRE